MAEKGKSTVTLMSTGDIGPVYEPTEEFAELIAPVLKQADLRLGQCERTYSERGWMPQYSTGPTGQHSRLHPRLAGVWDAAGIDVVSLASNHAMDWGPEAMLDTADLFRSRGKLVTGGGRPKDLNRGYFVELTIFSNVTSDMTIAKEEIFGPVVSVMPYENEEDAIRIANNSSYGLSGAVFTKDQEKGLALAKRIRTGNVTVNGLNLQINAPFGGYKESGIGRVGGPEGLEGYQEIKTVYLPA